MSDLATLPETTALAKESTDLHTQCQEFEIIDAQSAQDAGQLLKIVKGLKEKVSATFDPVVDLAFKAHKAAVAARNEHMSPLDASDRLLRKKLGDYQFEEQRKREAEIRRRQAQAEAEEAERREREAAVQREIIEKQRHEAAAAKRAGDEARAKELREQANKQAAEVRAAEAAPVVVAIVAPPPPPKVAGVTVRMVPDFTIEDASKLPAAYLIPDEKAIRKVVAALGEKANIPGVRVFLKPATSVR